MKLGLDLCHYCGAIATTRDHIRPVSATGATARDTDNLTVPACRNCNCAILNDIPKYNDILRGRHVANVLALKLLRTPKPKWTVAEAKAELTGRLLREIVKRIHQYETLVMRAEWAQERWGESD